MVAVIIVLVIVAAVVTIMIFKPKKVTSLMTSTTPSASTTNAPGSSTPIPSTPVPMPPVLFKTIPGNNSSVSCARFCNGGWGKSALGTAYPAYTGAIAAQTGGPNASTGGTCKCALTNQVKYDPVIVFTPELNWLENDKLLPKSPLAFDVVTGNNGSVTCANYCNRSAALKSKYPLFSGAVSAQEVGTNDKPTDGATGTCACMMTNRAMWDQTSKADATNQELLANNTI